MKQLKYLLSLFLVGVLAFSFASCGGDDDDEFDGTNENNQSTNIIDSGVHGKFEKLTINDTPVYNCIEAMIHFSSTYCFKPDYLTWRNNQYEYEPSVCIDLKMYDAPNIEASGLASISLYLKESAFNDEILLRGGTVHVTSKLMAIYVELHSKTEFGYMADYEEEFSVLAGSIKLKKKKDKEYVVTFDNFKIKMRNDEASINGSASFEEF